MREPNKSSDYQKQYKAARYVDDMLKPTLLPYLDSHPAINKTVRVPILLFIRKAGVNVLPWPPTLSLSIHEVQIA